MLAGDEPLPAHLRQRRRCEAPERSGGAAFLTGLLAPARSGLVLDAGRPRARGARARAWARAWPSAATCCAICSARTRRGRWAGSGGGGARGAPPRGRGRAATAAHWRDRAAATAAVLAAAREAAVDPEVTHAG